ncbi:MAG: Hsp70 family protein [Chlamydiota bacterium]
MENSRYIIGIDLGTTNCSVCYVDTTEAFLQQHPLKIPQVISAGLVESVSLLPSYCYLASDYEFPSGALKLPWHSNAEYFVGHFAKDHGMLVPSHLVSSAKSWLCNPAASRHEKILPPDNAPELEQISPVEATRRYLEHIRSAWDHQVAKGDPDAYFDEQEVIVTVPASFDEVARTLTITAAQQAGYKKMTLLEEPQAAFYSWVSQHEKSWESLFVAGDTILVCDIGGGTSDFSLIEVQQSGDHLVFQRMAVGDHLLLGGDNMDLALAYYLEDKYNLELNGKQWHQLVHLARQAKESLLDAEKEEVYNVALQGEGSQVVAGSIALQIQRQEVVELLAEGFFPLNTYDDARQIIKGGGVRRMGLPYENDPAITKHLASFLDNKPAYILFNGGTMKPQLFQERIVDNIESWFGGDLRVLKSSSLDYAVGRGAAYYGKVRRGLGVSIGSALPRTYYLGVEVEGKTKLLTIMSRGRSAGTKVVAEQDFLLSPNMPVSFRLWSSHTRLEDREGEIVDIDEEQMHALPPIFTALRYGKGSTDKLPVELEVYYSEIGVLELSLKAKNSDHRWGLSFQLQAASGQDNAINAITSGTSGDETVDEGFLAEVQENLKEAFRSRPAKVMQVLDESLQRPRQEWSPAILRGLWPALVDLAESRKVSPQHEARWWNLAGYFLRPGYGYSCDDFRIKELWRIILQPLAFGKDLEVSLQQLICFRRIAGGLGRGQQAQLASQIVATLFDKKKKNILLKSKRDIQTYSEKIRALGAFELLDLNLKISLGNAIVKRISAGEGGKSDFWALARLGSRHLLYGTIANVISVEKAQEWVEQLLELDDSKRFFPLLQLARQTDRREINLPENIVGSVADHFDRHQRPDLKKQLTDDHLSHLEEEQIFGDHLPQGLMLASK